MAWVCDQSQSADPQDYIPSFLCQRRRSKHGVNQMSEGMSRRLRTCQKRKISSYINICSCRKLTKMWCNRLLKREGLCINRKLLLLRVLANQFAYQLWILPIRPLSYMSLSVFGPSSGTTFITQTSLALRAAAKDPMFDFMSIMFLSVFDSIFGLNKSQ